MQAGNGFDKEWYLHTAIAGHRATYCVGASSFEEGDLEIIDLAIGVSVCSEKDQFVKKIGRVKARDRAIQAQQYYYQTFQIKNGSSNYSFRFYITPETVELSRDNKALFELRETVVHYIWKVTKTDSLSDVMKVILAMVDLFDRH